MFSSNTTQQSGGYKISRSLRFNSADSAYLNRTPASASNRTTWTWSGWVKRSSFGTDQQLFSAGGSGAFQFLYQTSTDCLYIYDSVSSTTSVITTQVFRDPSAWYHVVLATDTTQATASNRFKLYINGVQVTSFGTATYPAQNSTLSVNNTVNHSVGSWSGAGGGNFFNGYMTEVNFIDGQALTPSSFGEYNSDTGVWQPKPYSGSYGTNGFYLNFSDNSNTTAATLGKDYSGNGNNWTPNNFSVAAGAGNDSLVDVPTPYGVDTGAGGEVRGNYETLNPLFNATTLSNGNLDVSLTSSSVTGTLGPNSGKWYFECTVNSISATAYLGIADQTLVKSDNSFSYSQVYVYLSSGFKGGNGSSAGYGASWTTGDVIGIAYDLDAGSITFYKNGVSQGVAFNTGFTSGYFWRPFLYGGTSTNTFTFNFGQRPFAYTAPSGYKALCTQNLPTPTIGATTATQANKYFDATLFTGTGSPLTVVNAGGFQPDLVWTKNRSSVAQHYLTNVLSGVSQYLVSDSTSAEQTGAQLYTSFNSNGFSMGTSGYPNGAAVVAWQWKANGSGSTNTAGSITSTVSANTTSGFSIVTFTGTGASATVGHGLGVAPKMIITKPRNNADDWYVYHASLGPTLRLTLNSTSAAGGTVWDNTAPTSTVFSISGGGFPNGWTEVAYCFAEVPGYSKFGSYTGNGANDGPFVYCGFRPKYVMMKCSSNAGLSWVVNDGTRNPTNVTNLSLFPDLSAAENAGSYLVDFCANGFKIRTFQGDINNSGYTFIFAAFAEFPQKFSLAR